MLLDLKSPESTGPTDSSFIPYLFSVNHSHSSLTPLSAHHLSSDTSFHRVKTIIEPQRLVVLGSSGFHFR